MSLQFKFFHISSRYHRETKEELNKFLRSHRVVTVHREFVADRENSYWSFAIEYLATASETEKQSVTHAGKKRMDYKEVLSSEDFSFFAKLREWRKRAAGEAGVSVYTIFTNEQLALIVTGRVYSKTDLRNIEGVGHLLAQTEGSYC